MKTLLSGEWARWDGWCGAESKYISFKISRVSFYNYDMIILKVVSLYSSGTLPHVIFPASRIWKGGGGGVSNSKKFNIHLVLKRTKELHLKMEKRQN